MQLLIRCGVRVGFEYWGDPNDATQGFITWMVDGKPSYKVTAAAVGPDTTVEIDQRLISREPMSIILNLGMSRKSLASTCSFYMKLNLSFLESFQTVDLTAMTFPGDFLIDYIRVYQRKGETNIGCDPPDFPTAQYINDHLEAYTSAFFYGSFWCLEKC